MSATGDKPKKKKKKIYNNSKSIVMGITITGNVNFINIHIKKNEDSLIGISLTHDLLNLTFL